MFFSIIVLKMQKTRKINGDRCIEMEKDDTGRKG